MGFSNWGKLVMIHNYSEMFLREINFQNCKNSRKSKFRSSKDVKLTARLSYVFHWFHVKYEWRKILEFPHCALDTIFSYRKWGKKVWKKNHTAGAILQNWKNCSILDIFHHQLAKSIFFTFDVLDLRKGDNVWNETEMRNSCVYNYKNFTLFQKQIKYNLWPKSK